MGAGLRVQVCLRNDDDIQRLREFLVEQLRLVQAGLDVPLHEGLFEIWLRDVVVMHLVAILAPWAPPSIRSCVGEVQRRIAPQLGNQVQMARQSHLHLISKLRCDAALYFPYTGPYAGRGPRRKYGDKVHYDNIPKPYLKETLVEGHIETRLYQAQLLHKEFPQPLNVVIIAKTNLHTQARAHVVLFSSDLDLAYAPLVDYYGLRFQIEFNFRDAKQYWGLEDFMNVTPTGVTNAANLSLFMVNVAYRLRADGHPRAPDYSVLDLKADWRGYKYVEETIKMLPEKPEPILFAKILNKVAGLGRIHASQPAFSFS